MNDDRWIPVTEDLPGAGSVVLAGNASIYGAFIRTDAGWRPAGDLPLPMPAPHPDEITHWRVFPFRPMAEDGRIYPTFERAGDAAKRLSRQMRGITPDRVVEVIELETGYLVARSHADHAGEHTGKVVLTIKNPSD